MSIRFFNQAARTQLQQQLAEEAANLEAKVLDKAAAAIARRAKKKRTGK